MVPRETPSPRTARSRKVCRILSDHVRRVVAAGLGEWDPAWEIVEKPSHQFLETLANWEETGDEEDLRSAKNLAIDVLNAWREANRQYQGLHESGRRKEAGIS